MKSKIKTLFLGLTLSAIALPSLASSYPNKPIRLVVPWAPGGATDVIARLVGQELSREVGQPIVVENKSGAGGNIGSSSMLREKADGYALVMTTSSTHAANKHLYSQLEFDPITDFTHIAMIGSIPNVLVVPPSSSFNSASELQQYAKENPKKLNYGSAGVGSSQHLAAEQLVQATNIEIEHIPYRGSGPAVADLLAGQLDFMLDTGSMTHITNGNLKALAVASKDRVPGLPNTPTFIEQGIPLSNAAAWYGIAAPAGTPLEVAESLNKSLNKVLKKPTVIERLEAMGVVVASPMNVTDLQEYVSSEVDRFGDLIQQANIQIE